MSQSDTAPFEGILDPGTMKQLLDLDDGQLGLIKEMHLLFLEDMPPRLAAIETALRKGNLPEVGDVAHAVKGAASTMGVPQVRALALALETLGRTGKGEETGEMLLEKLKIEYDRAQEALGAFIASKDVPT